MQPQQQVWQIQVRCDSCAAINQWEDTTKQTQQWTGEVAHQNWCRAYTVQWKTKDGAQQKGCRNKKSTHADQTLNLLAVEENQPRARTTTKGQLKTPEQDAGQPEPGTCTSPSCRIVKCYPVQTRRGNQSEDSGQAGRQAGRQYVLHGTVLNTGQVLVATQLTRKKETNAHTALRKYRCRRVISGTYTEQQGRAQVLICRENPQFNPDSQPPPRNPCHHELTGHFVLFLYLHWKKEISLARRVPGQWAQSLRSPDSAKKGLKEVARLMGCLCSCQIGIASSAWVLAARSIKNSARQITSCEETMGK